MDQKDCSRDKVRGIAESIAEEKARELDKKIREHRIRRFKENVLDRVDDYKVRFKNFFDFKYKKERKKLVEEGETDRVPIKKATIKDVGYLSRKNSSGQVMNCVKTKSGAVVVVPGSSRNLRGQVSSGELNDGEIVESLIKE